MLNIDRLIEEFNRKSDQFRLLTLVSPTCPLCLYGKAIIRGIFKHLDPQNLLCLTIWVPMMDRDTLEAATTALNRFPRGRFAYFWDGSNQMGRRFSKTMDLKTLMWDSYLLYPPGVQWEDETPPQPEFWMHQLPTSTGADGDLLFTAKAFVGEVISRVGIQIDDSPNDFALLLHSRAINEMSGNPASYTVEEITGATRKA